MAVYHTICIKCAVLSVAALVAMKHKVPIPFDESPENPKVDSNDEMRMQKRRSRKIPYDPISTELAKSIKSPST